MFQKLQARFLAWRFERLREKWARDTAEMSSLKQITGHPSYRKIISLGYPAVPLILREWEREWNHWGPALYAITKEHPFLPREHRGKIQEMRNAWINWGKGKKYI